MVDVIKEKENLTNTLTDRYSRSIISLDEYEKIIDRVNKIESVKDLREVQKYTYENGDLMLLEDAGQKHVTVFSWRSVNLRPVGGNAGRFITVFGANQIKVDNLPKGKTFLHIDSIFSLTEIWVSKKIRVTNNTVPVLSGIFAPNDAEQNEEDMPELHITGKAVFGNITIIRTD